MIDHKNKFIFVHIPKTGGTSIENSLRSPINGVSISAKHWTLKDYVLNNTFCSDYFTFSFVRNPWDMTVSMYYYLWKSNGSWPTVWRKKNQHFSKLSFSEWLKDETFKTPVIRSTNVTARGGQDGNLLDWVEHNHHKVNFIGRFENLQDDFNIVCDKIGIPRQQLPHINKTKHKHYTEYYDKETKQIVAEKYAKDIEYFGYEFGK
jgi:hypothetical protein